MSPFPASAMELLLLEFTSSRSCELLTGPHPQPGKLDKKRKFAGFEIGPVDQTLKIHKNTFSALSNNKSFGTSLFLRNIHAFRFQKNQTLTPEQYRFARWIYISVYSFLFLFNKDISALFDQCFEILSDLSGRKSVHSDVMATMHSVATFLMFLTRGTEDAEQNLANKKEENAKMKKIPFPLVSWITNCLKDAYPDSSARIHFNAVSAFLRMEAPGVVKCRETGKLMAVPRLCLCEAANFRYNKPRSSESCEERIKFGFAEWNNTHLRALLLLVLKVNQNDGAFPLATRKLVYQLANADEFNMYIAATNSADALGALVHVLGVLREPPLSRKELHAFFKAHEFSKQSVEFATAKAIFEKVYLRTPLDPNVSNVSIANALSLIKVIQNATGGRQQPEQVRIVQKALSTLDILTEASDCVSDSTTATRSRRVTQRTSKSQPATGRKSKKREARE
jgi:hypothetical protein